MAWIAFQAFPGGTWAGLLGGMNDTNKHVGQDGSLAQEFRNGHDDSNPNGISSLWVCVRRFRR